jgi:hypothetical protein
MFSGIFSEADKNTVLPMNKTTGTEGSSYLYNSRGEAGFVRTSGGKRKSNRRRGRRGGCWTKKNSGGKSHRRRRSRYTRTRK